MAVRTKVLRANVQSDGSENQLGSRLLRNQRHALDAEEASFDERDARASAVLGSAKTNS